MKTKTWLIASSILLVPMFFMGFIMLIVPMEMTSVIVNTEHLLKLNWNFIMCASVVNLLSMSVIFTTIMVIIPKSHVIDKLNDEIVEYQKATKELKETRKKLIKLIEEK
jgi:hypothetical protein